MKKTSRPLALALASLLMAFGAACPQGPGSADAGPSSGPTLFPNPNPNPNPNPDADTDGDGLKDVDEVDVYGTNPEVADTDGDGFTDFDEIIEKAFDPSVDATQFNPLVADVPKLRVELVSAPSIGVNYIDENAVAQSEGTERTNETRNAHSNSWGGSQSYAVEMTHTAGVEVGVEHEFGLLGGTTVSASLNYEFSHSTTNESTSEWSQEQTTENSEALARIQQIEQTQTITEESGYLQVLVQLANEGDIAFLLDGLTLSAFEANPTNPYELGPVGTMTFLDGQGDVFPETVIQPGDTLMPMNFTAEIDLDTARGLMADSNNLVISPVTGTLQGNGELNFELASTNINARTAQVIIDYGIHRPQESYRVATVADRANPRITAREALEDILRVPYVTGVGQWKHHAATTASDTGQGLLSVRDVAMDDELSSYWIVSHSRPTDAGASIESVQHNLILSGYDLDAIELQKGHTLHLVYVEDPDRDGLGTRAELLYGTDPLDPDTDDDGLSDSQEISGWTITYQGDDIRVKSNPLVVDTDFDGDDDLTEFNAGTHPNLAPANEAPVIEQVEATVVGFDVALVVTANDPDANLSRYEIDWGDGGPIEAFDVAAPLVHTYVDEGGFLITVVAFDAHEEQSQPISLGVNATLPTEELVLHLPLAQGDISDHASGLNVSYSGQQNFSTDRHGLGEAAASLHNNNESGNLALISTENLGVTESFTMAVWVKLESGSFYGNDARIAGQGNWFNIYSPGSGLSFGILDGLYAPNGAVTAHTNNIGGSDWNYVVGVVERLGPGQSAIRLYMNGALVDEQTAPTTFNNPGVCRFYVGNFGDNDLCTGTSADEFTGFPGSVDDVRVYDRALSTAEIGMLFAEGGSNP